MPPFGSLWPGVATVVDNSLILQGPELNFNAGLRTFSVCGLAVKDFLAIEKPAMVGDYSEVPQSEGGGKDR